MTQGTATKKPVEIHWLRYDKNKQSALYDWVVSFKDNLFKHFPNDGSDDLKVMTIEGSSYVVPDGYIIIRGVRGEYYPCEPGIFQETYNIIA